MKELKNIWNLLSAISVFGFVVMFVLWIFDVKEFSIIDSGTFLSVLIAVLAIIVALVVGFQISNAIEITRKMEEVSKKINDIDNLKKDIEQKEEKIQKLSNSAMTGISAAMIGTASTQADKNIQTSFLIMSIVVEQNCDLTKHESNNRLISRYQLINDNIKEIISKGNLQEPLWWADFKSIEYPKEMKGYDEIISAHRSVIVKIDEALEAKKAKEQAPQS